MALTVKEAIGRYSRPPWYKNRHLRMLYCLMVPGIVFVHTSVGFDSSLAGTAQLLDTWQKAMHNPVGGILGLLTASYSIGSIASLPFAPYVSNKFGRRYVVFMGAIVTLIGVVLQTASQNIGMYVAGRIVIGFGDGFSMSGSPVLLAELAHAGDRVKFNTLFSTFWNLGSVCNNWLSFIASHKLATTSWQWRMPCFVQAFWTLCVVVAIFILPESPRWLISKGRDDEAWDFLVKYHADGDEDDEIIKAEYQEISNWIREERKFNEGKSLFSVLSSTGNRRRIIILVSLGIFQQCIGSALILTYLNSTLTTIGVTSSNIKTLISSILSTWSWLVSIFATLNIERFGRRTLFLSATFALWLCFIAWTAASGVYTERKSHDAAGAVIAFIVLYTTVFNLVWNPLPFMYSDEVMTFELRSKGASFYLAVQQSAVIFNSFVNAIGVQHLQWRFYIVYDCWLILVMIIIYVFFVETNGYSLEEIGILFDAPGSKLYGKPVGTLPKDDESFASVKDETVVDVYQKKQ